MATMAPGWEERFDENGTPYYENTTTGETSWEYPQMEEAADDAAGSSAADVDKATQKKLKKLQKAEKKAENERKKANMKEAAMKADISKMKAETRQAKKELAEGKKEAEAAIRKAREEVETILMDNEDKDMKRGYMNSRCYVNLLEAIHNRKEMESREALKDLTNLEKEAISPVVDRVVTEAIATHEGFVSKIAKLEEDLSKTRSDLKYEIRERARENAEWSAKVDQLNQEKEELTNTIDNLEQQVDELNKYIEESEYRYQQELERQRKEDVNTISTLTASLEFEKVGREDDLRSIAELWADDMAPPTVLRKHVREVRIARAEEKLEKAQIENLRFGAQVMCWFEDGNDYYPGTITKVDHREIEGITYYQVTWEGGAEAAPVWAKEGELYAVIEDDTHKDQETQTELRLYDDLINRISTDPEVRSARGKIDYGASKNDERVAKALDAKAKREAASIARASLEGIAKLLFKTIDIDSNGEIFNRDAWRMIQHQVDVKELVGQHRPLEPMTRKKYFFPAWKKIEPDFDTPIVWREFRDVCIEALLLSRGLDGLDGDNESDSDSDSDDIDSELGMNESEKDPSEDVLTVNPAEANAEELVNVDELILPWLSKEEMSKDEEVKKMVENATQQEEKMIIIHENEVKRLRELMETSEDIKKMYEERQQMFKEEQSAWVYEESVLLNRFNDIKINGIKNSETSNEKAKPEVDMYPGQDDFLVKAPDEGQYKELHSPKENDESVDHLPNAKSLHIGPAEIIENLSRNSRALEQKIAQLDDKAKQTDSKIKYFESQINKVKEDEKTQNTAEPSEQQEQDTDKISKLENEIKKLEKTKRDLTKQQETLHKALQESQLTLADAEQLLPEYQRASEYVKQLHGQNNSTETLPELEHAKKTFKYWNAELKGEYSLWESQYQCILLSRELRQKLVREMTRGVHNVQELLDHKETLFARREAAEAAIKVAQNEIEQKRAKGHLDVVNATVEDELKYFDEQWSRELQSRRKLVNERMRVAKEHIIRANASLRTSEERQRLRSIVVEEIQIELETVKMKNSLNSSSDEPREKALEAWTTNTVEKQRERRKKIVLVRKEAMERELEWVKQNETAINGFSEKWIIDKEKERLMQDADLARRAKTQALAYFNEQEKLRKAQVDQIQAKCNYYKQKQIAQEKSFTHELDTLTNTFKTSVGYLQVELSKYKVATKEWRRLARERVDAVTADYFGLVVKLDERIKDLLEKAVIRENWVKTLQDDARRNANEAKRLAEERRNEILRSARQMDDLNGKYNAMTQHANRLDNWVNSLKKEVKMFHELIEKKKIEERILRQEHAKEIRWLKWEIWKRDETARMLGTNLDFAFVFFGETLSRLVGTSKEYNQRLAANAGLEVLLALCKSSRIEMRHLAMKALSNSSWDGHKDFRTVVRSAREDWLRWIASITSITALHWSLKGKRIPPKPLRRLLRLTDSNGSGNDNDDSMNPENTFIDEKEDPPSLFKSVAAGSTVKVYQNRPKIVTQGVALKDVGPNLPNQERVGIGLSGRETGAQELVSLLYSRDALLRRLATKTIAVLALEEPNKIRIGESEHSFSSLIELARNGKIMNDIDKYKNVDQAKAYNEETIFIEVCEDDDDIAETQRYALSALANLLYQDRENQSRFGVLNGIDTLIYLVKNSKDMDVLDSCTAAFANAASMHEENCARIGIGGGIEALVHLINSVHAAEHLDDIGARIQANAAETLVNATKDDSRENVTKIGEVGVKPLVQLCASDAVTVQRCAGMILGNIAQTEEIRIKIGDCGGIEALLILGNSDDVNARENATWALSNLAWNSENQNRIGKYLPQLVKLCQDECLQVRENTTGALANALFYHEGNRKRIGFYFPACEILIRLLKDKEQSFKLHENVLRALGTAAYNDAVALQAVIHGVLPSIIEHCKSEYEGLKRYGAFALGNLAVHDVHKPMIVEMGGIEILSWLCGSDCPDTVKYAKEALDILADLGSAKDMELRRKEFGVKGIVQLCLGKEDYDKYGNPLPPQPAVQALACESLASHENVEEVVDAKGLEALVQVFRESTEKQFEEGVRPDLQKLQTRALWALREIVRSYPVARSLLGRLGALKHIFSSLDLKTTNSDVIVFDYILGDDVAEAALALIYSMVIDHEANCRRVFDVGIDSLIFIADMGEKMNVKSSAQSNIIINNNAQEEGLDMEAGEFRFLEQQNDVTKKATIQLALDILEVMGPHSWLICSNCSSKEKCGTTCSHCGRVLEPRIE